jgi:hypothetical protein
VAVATGGVHACVIDGASRARCWGRDGSGAVTGRDDAVGADELHEEPTLVAEPKVMDAN